MTPGIRCALFVLTAMTGGTLSAGAAAAETPPPADERLAANQEFRSAFDTGSYETALPLAMQVVELTSSQFGAEATQLVNPLANLGTTLYRLREYGPAMDSYRRALALLDNESDSASPQLIRPLQGLGLALLALDRDEEAIIPLKRAVDIIRNREGLFSVSQLPLLRPLTAAYMGTQRREEAGTTQQYALTVAETAYGRNDVRILPQLDEFGRWNEVMGRYSMARLLHARAVQIAGKQTLDGRVLATDGLRGIARSYRYAYLFGETEEAAASAFTASMSDSQLQRAITGPVAEGERALRTALELLRAQPSTDARAAGEVLMDLGDWYLIAGADARAVATYRESWKYLNEAGAAQMLAVPVPITYRPPAAAVSRGVEDADSYEERDIDLVVSVDTDGKVREATVPNPQAGHESVERSVASAVRRSRFRPALVDGEVVAKTDVPFRERVYVRRAETR